MRVLVTDSDNRSALAATRALGGAGHEVYTAGDRPQTLASVSRHSTAHCVYPNPLREPQGFVAAVIDFAIRHRIRVLMPMTEVSTILLTENRGRLPPEVVLPFADSAILKKAADKAYVLSIAQELSVPVPKTELLVCIEDAERMSRTLSYPAVIKPARSRVLVGRHWISTSVSYAADSGQFLAVVGRLSPEVYPLLVQERIEGDGAGVFVCVGDNGLQAAFAHRRLREKPPSGGQSVLSESVAMDPVLLGHATRLLEAIGWRGVAMVEFKRDNRDGCGKLMEINGRFWGSLQLAIDSGVDFPNLLVDVFTDAAPDRALPYAIGVQTRWFWGDVDSLLSVMFKSRASLSLPPSHPGRWRTLCRFLQLFGRKHHLEVERADDPAPALLEARRWLTGR